MPDLTRFTAGSSAGRQAALPGPADGTPIEVTARGIPDEEAGVLRADDPAGCTLRQA